MLVSNLNMFCRIRDSDAVTCVGKARIHVVMSEAKAGNVRTCSTSQCWPSSSSANAARDRCFQPRGANAACDPSDGHTLTWTTQTQKLEAQQLEAHKSHDHAGARSI